MTMRSQPSPSENAAVPDSPGESIGQHIRWQVLLALAGILILATLLGYSTYSVPTVLVPGRGGIFREGVVGAPKYINPLRCEVHPIDYDLCTLLYRGLTSVDVHGRIVPDLADSWTVSPDGLAYDFRLKPDQFWDDGRPVTADDVIFTVGVIQNPEVFSLPALSSLWQSVVAEKVDDRTVRFRLKEAFSPFLDYTTIGLLPKHIFETWPVADVVNQLNKTPVGNGPMKVKELAADRILLETNPYFGGPTPYLEGLELRFYPDSPSLLTGFLAGEIEGISHVRPEMISEVRTRDELQLFSSTQPFLFNILLNLNNPNTPFFQDKLVRQALMYGMNREALIQKVTANQGIIAHSPIIPENWAYNPNVRHYNYDPITAQALLDQAGWRDTNGDGVRDKDGRPLQFVLHTYDDPTNIAAINQIAQDWEAIGVRAIPTPVTFAGLASDVLAPRRFEAALLKWETPGDPDPYPLWHSTQATGAGQNYGGWNNEEVDQVIAQARSASTEEQRRALYAKFQEIFTDEMPALLLYSPVYTYGVADSVYNVQIGALNHPSQRFRGFADWYMVTRRVPANQAPSSAPPTPPGSTPAPTDQALP